MTDEKAKMPPVDLDLELDELEIYARDIEMKRIRTQLEDSMERIRNQLEYFNDDNINGRIQEFANTFKQLYNSNNQYQSENLTININSTQKVDLMDLEPLGPQLKQKLFKHDKKIIVNITYKGTSKGTATKKMWKPQYEQMWKLQININEIIEPVIRM